MTFVQELLLFQGIAVASVIGSYIRFGLGYFNSPISSIAYSIMYAEILGCIIMGMASKFKPIVASLDDTKYLLYVVVTSGLCGSITTFSTWQLECNKGFLAAIVTSSGTAYAGSKLFEWSVCLWAGVAIPLMALHFGYILGELSAHVLVSVEGDNVIDEAGVPDGALDAPIVETRSAVVLTIMLVFITFFTLTSTIPPLIFGEVANLAYIAVFGAVGAYTRYILSGWNRTFTHFPLGTFFVNILGSCIAAALTLFSKCSRPTTPTQSALLSGGLVGFCGCLTTVSSFVSELDAMRGGHVRSAILYGLSSVLLAQICVVLIYDVYTVSYCINQVSS